MECDVQVVFYLTMQGDHQSPAINHIRIIRRFVSYSNNGDRPRLVRLT